MCQHQPAALRVTICGAATRTSRLRRLRLGEEGLSKFVSATVDVIPPWGSSSTARRAATSSRFPMLLGCAELRAARNRRIVHFHCVMLRWRSDSCHCCAFARHLRLVFANRVEQSRPRIWTARTWRQSASTNSGSAVTGLRADTGERLRVHYFPVLRLSCDLAPAAVGYAHPTSSRHASGTRLISGKPWTPGTKHRRCVLVTVAWLTWQVARHAVSRHLVLKGTTSTSCGPAVQGD
jgi:hypothetical protein